MFFIYLLLKVHIKREFLLLSMFHFAAYVSVHTDTEMGTDTRKSGKSHCTYFA